MPKLTLSNDRTFECRADQTILESARVQGILLEHSCRTGRCGVCKTLVLDGVTKTINPEESLGIQEQTAGFILTCCRSALSDVVLDIEDIGEISSTKPKTLPCRILNLAYLSEDVIEVTLRVPPTSGLDYVPGQYIDVIGKNGLRRSYSMANAPRADGTITLQIRKVPEGQMARYWFQEARVNDLLRLEGPLGTFRLRPISTTNIVMLATGTGIAPIRAMLEDLAWNSAPQVSQQVHVYWGGRTERDLYWVPDFPMLPLRFVSVLSRAQNPNTASGYVQDAVLRDGIDLHNAVVYACGSNSMIASAKHALVSAGLNPKRFYSDAFLSSN